MDSIEKTYLDVDELAKKIEQRIKELELKEEKRKQNLDYQSKETGSSIANLDEIIDEIDKRIRELEIEEKETENINLDDLTNHINEKLNKMDDIIEEDLGKTIYDLQEISKKINATILELERKKKEKKRKKAMYCDIAREKNRQNRRKENKK